MDAVGVRYDTLADRTRCVMMIQAVVVFAFVSVFVFVLAGNIRWIGSLDR